MSQLSDSERATLVAFSELIYCNPFEEARIAHERAVIGDAHQPEPLDAWSRTAATDRLERPSVVAINERASQLAEQLLQRQSDQSPLRGAEAELYDDLVTYVLYYRHVAPQKGDGFLDGTDGRRVADVWRSFHEDRERFLAPLEPGDREKTPDSAHLFACLHQVRRAFYWIFGCLIGESRPSTRLRAAVWQSVFTHDLRRYRRTLYRRMGDLSTLVTGPSGSGKELVAQSIGRSQYHAFDAKAERLVGEGDPFLPLNLSALSPTLIESELFGHRKGAFTGAVTDREGWLEHCPAHGAVFLDEIGELDQALQVKLLRVAQSRDFSRLGETKSRAFLGKLIAATNRDLATEMRAGRFREDLYYRLCSDQVQAPSLAEQLADRPDAIHGLLRFLAGRVLDEADTTNDEADSLASETHTWIERELPGDYAWPGNTRELEQCVRSVLVRREYRPPAPENDAPPRPTWLASAERGELTADELVTAYTRHVYERVGGYEPTAKVLQLDRRTVKRRVTGD